MRLSAGKVIGALVVLFVLMQAIIPAKTNPPTDPSATLRAMRPAGDPVMAVFDRSCRDCHSNDTTWPWYSKVAPVSWLVAHDVNDGRRELNTSEFGTYPARKQQRKLQEACEQVKKGEMPMWVYTLQHPDAKLRPGDVELICSLSASMPPASTPQHAPAPKP